MEKKTLKVKIKRFIAGIGFEMFLWGLGLTQDEYFEQIYEQEKMFRTEYPKP